MQTLNTRILTVAALAVGAMNGQTTASVTGSVLENGTVPLGGAVVSYQGSGHFNMDSQGRAHFVRPQVIGTVQSRSDGTFSIAGLPPDRYVICAGGTLPIHISSCAWNTLDHRVSIAAGQNVSGLKLNVARGALLDITINDSTGCGARYSKAPVYVFAGSMSAQAYPVPATTGAYHYRALVPQMTPLRVSANHRCSFADSTGSALPNVGLSVPAVAGESANATLTAR